MLKALSVIGYVGMAGAVVGLLFTRSLFSPSPWAVGVQVAAVLLLIWARATFGRRSFHFAANPTEGGLVTVGPYRYVRHPIYTALCFFVWAGVVANWSWYAAALGAVVVVSAIVRMRCEEILVAACYPEYREYCARTWRMIPYVF
jgi:protein-S-isoprenylcysteine O-methyltransferase Ste14